MNSEAKPALISLRHRTRMNWFNTHLLKKWKKSRNQYFEILNFVFLIWNSADMIVFYNGKNT